MNADAESLRRGNSYMIIHKTVIPSSDTSLKPINVNRGP